MKASRKHYALLWFAQHTCSGYSCMTSGRGEWNVANIISISTHIRVFPLNCVYTRSFRLCQNLKVQGILSGVLLTWTILGNFQRSWH